MATSVNVNLEYQNAQRFPAWMALSVFSAVCLAAVNSQLLAQKSAADKWILSVTIVSMSFSFLAVMAYLFVRHLFVAQIPEYGTCILLLAFWGAGLPVLMNPNRGIAVEGEEVVNANLYFFSWLSLAAVVYIAASLLEEYGISVRQVAANNAKAGRWYGLAASSMIVMVSSVRLFVSKNCSNDIWTGTETCKRTKFGISMGVISFVWAFGLGFMMHKVSKFLELASSTMLLTLWCFGVGFITFGESPGARIGNLYFSTWISFIIIVFLFAQVFRDFMSARSQGAEEEPKEEGEGEHDLEMHNSSSPEVPPEDDI